MSEETAEMDIDRQLERTLTQINPDSEASPPALGRKRLLAEMDAEEVQEVDLRSSTTMSPLKRQVLANTGNVLSDVAALATPSKSPGFVEPLSIKKKTSSSSRTSPGGTHRRTQTAPSYIPTRMSSQSEAGPSRIPSIDRGRPTQPVVRAPIHPAPERLLVAAETTKEDVSIFCIESCFC